MTIANKDKMLKTIDILVITFTITTFILVAGTTLAGPGVRHIFTDIVTINTTSQFGETVTLDLLGRCYLGDVRGSCVDIIATILSGGYTGYESPESLDSIQGIVDKVVRFQKVLFAVHKLFHGVLLVTCYALICFAWKDTSSSSDADRDQGSLRPLERFTIMTIGLSTLAGTVATVTGLAVSISLSNILQGSLGPDDMGVGSGWVITLAATLGCLLATEKAVEVLYAEAEGGINLPTDEESSRDEGSGEKSTYVRRDALPVILA